MMRRNRPRSRIILSSPVTLVLALVALVFIVRAAVNIYARAALSTDRLDEASVTIKKMEIKKADLEYKIQNLSTNEGIVASIREKYHAIEPGESVAIIVNTDTSSKGGGDATSSDQAETMQSPRLWWRRILQAVGL